MEEEAPGFRFYPTEEELVSFYLPQKLEGRRQDLDRVIPILNVYEFDPWELPQLAGELCRRDPEQWFFFIPIQEKEARGGRPCRLTSSGYWKATGSPGLVYSSTNRVVGLKRTMVFYRGRAPMGKKTEWKMNEYKATEGEALPATAPKLREEMSLCRVYIKSKCARSFDRRPVGVGNPRKQDRQWDEAEPSRRSEPTERASEPDHSSSSGDPRAAAAFSENMEIDKGDEGADHVPLWDWEQVNWF